MIRRLVVRQLIVGLAGLNILGRPIEGHIGVGIGRMGIGHHVIGVGIGHHVVVVAEDGVVVHHRGGELVVVLVVLPLL